MDGSPSQTMDGSLASLFTENTLPRLPFPLSTDHLPAEESTEELKHMLIQANVDLESSKAAARAQAKLFEGKLQHLEDLLRNARQERDEAWIEILKLKDNFISTNLLLDTLQVGLQNNQEQSCGHFGDPDSLHMQQSSKASSSPGHHMQQDCISSSIMLADSSRDIHWDLQYLPELKPLEPMHPDVQSNNLSSVFYHPKSYEITPDGHSDHQYPQGCNHPCLHDDHQQQQQQHLRCDGFPCTMSMCVSAINDQLPAEGKAQDYLASGQEQDDQQLKVADSLNAMLLHKFKSKGLMSAENFVQKASTTHNDQHPDHLHQYQTQQHTWYSREQGGIIEQRQVGEKHHNQLVSLHQQQQLMPWDAISIDHHAFPGPAGVTEIGLPIPDTCVSDRTKGMYLLPSLTNGSIMAAVLAPLEPCSYKSDMSMANTSTGLMCPSSSSSSSTSASAATTTTAAAPGSSTAPLMRIHLPEPPEANPEVMLRSLPEKGKLLQAVMRAGPLLQTLLLAGPLPQWRRPPPKTAAPMLPFLDSMETSCLMHAPPLPSNVRLPSSSITGQFSSLNSSLRAALDTSLRRTPNSGELFGEFDCIINNHQHGGDTMLAPSPSRVEQSCNDQNDTDSNEWALPKVSSSSCSASSMVVTTSQSFPQVAKGTAAMLNTSTNLSYSSRLLKSSALLPKRLVFRERLHTHKLT